MSGALSPSSAGLGRKDWPQTGFPLKTLLSVFTEMIHMSPFNRGTSVTPQRAWVLKLVLVRMWSLVVLAKMFKAFLILWGDLSELSSEVRWPLCPPSCVRCLLLTGANKRDSLPKSIRQSHVLTLNSVMLTHAILGTSCRHCRSWEIWLLNLVCPVYAGSFLPCLSYPAHWLE